MLFKAFSGLIKRSNVFERERYIKIKDVSQRKLFWEICHTLSAKLQQAYHDKKFTKFCFYIDWHKLFINFCDERLARRKMHYFEDVCVALDRICLIDEDSISRQYRLVSEMIDGKVLSKIDQFCHAVDQKEKDFLVFKNVLSQERDPEHGDK